MTILRILKMENDFAPYFTDENYDSTEHRPWGFFTVLWEESDFKIKRIGVAPGGSLSLQYHLHRKEVWNIISGEGSVSIGETVFPARVGDRFEIPQGALHRASSDKGMVFIEVQSGDYLGEDDIVRLEDVYGRDRDNNK